MSSGTQISEAVFKNNSAGLSGRGFAKGGALFSMYPIAVRVARALAGTGLAVSGATFEANNADIGGGYSSEGQKP